MQRRKFLGTSSQATVLGLLAGVGLLPAAAKAQSAGAWNKTAFESKSLADVVKAMGGAAPTLSQDVTINAPEIAENGNVVRMGFGSKLAGTTMVALLVEKNPNTLAALFDVVAGTDADYATNVKMGQSSNVYAVAKVGDKFFYNVKETKVTLGGCGG